MCAGREERRTAFPRLLRPLRAAVKYNDGSGGYIGGAAPASPTASTSAPFSGRVAFLRYRCSKATIRSSDGAADFRPCSTALRRTAAAMAADRAPGNGSVSSEADNQLL